MELCKLLVLALALLGSIGVCNGTHSQQGQMKATRTRSRTRKYAQTQVQTPPPHQEAKTYTLTLKMPETKLSTYEGVEGRSSWSAATFVEHHISIILRFCQSKARREKDTTCPQLPSSARTLVQLLRSYSAKELHKLAQTLSKIYLCDAVADGRLNSDHACSDDDEDDVAEFEEKGYIPAPQEAIDWEKMSNTSGIPLDEVDEVVSHLWVLAPAYEQQLPALTKWPTDQNNLDNHPWEDVEMDFFDDESRAATAKALESISSAVDEDVTSKLVMLEKSGSFESRLDDASKHFFRHHKPHYGGKMPNGVGADSVALLGDLPRLSIPTTVCVFVDGKGGKVEKDVILKHFETWVNADRVFGRFNIHFDVSDETIHYVDDSYTFIDGMKHFQDSVFSGVDSPKVFLPDECKQDRAHNLYIYLMHTIVSGVWGMGAFPWMKGRGRAYLAFQMFTGRGGLFGDKSSEHQLTVAHEIGHCLGLMHPWHDNGGGATGCDEPNDYIASTAPQRSPSGPDPTCTAGHSCSIAETDNIGNIMDYSYTKCKTGFTDEQGLFMRKAIEVFWPEIGQQQDGGDETPRRPVAPRQPAKPTVSDIGADGSEASDHIGGRATSGDGSGTGFPRPKQEKMTCPLCGKSVLTWARHFAYHLRSKDVALEQGNLHGASPGAHMTCPECQETVDLQNWEQGPAVRIENTDDMPHRWLHGHDLGPFRADDVKPKARGGSVPKSVTECPVCHTRDIGEDSLKGHLMKHIAEKEHGKIQECPICGSSITRLHANQLGLHLAYHGRKGDLPVPLKPAAGHECAMTCPVCDKRVAREQWQGSAHQAPTDYHRYIHAIDLGDFKPDPSCTH